MRLEFLGATQTVTGSKYLLESYQDRLLIDCGLFQGHKTMRERNWEEFPYPPNSINNILITHAHIDHTGFLPRLYKQGFHGKIHATEATYDLCKILLMDSAHLQEEDALRANKYGYSKHHPALPLYTTDDVEQTLKLFHVVPSGQNVRISPNIVASWHRAGHILGASMIQIICEDNRILFSGDLGRPHDPIFKPPAIIQEADYLVLESTYGNRPHAKLDPGEQLEAVIKETIQRGGSVLIPAFAVGRAQTVLYYLHRLKTEGKLDHIPIYLDSPMAINATDIFLKHSNAHNLSKAHAEAICKMATYVRTPDESRQLDTQPMPKIILSASGMVTGGRVLHHLKAFVSSPENTVVFAGFQVPGTRGAKMVEGVDEIKIHGDYHPIRAQIKSIQNLSAHADADEMLDWLRHFHAPPAKTFLTHGDLNASEALKARIESTYQWKVEIPHYRQQVII